MPGPSGEILSPLSKARLAMRKRQAKVEEFVLRGLTDQTAIALRLGCCQKTISNDMRAIKKRWIEDLRGSVKKRKALRIKQLEAGAFAAMASYERSREDRERVTTSYNPGRCPSCRGSGFEEEGAWCSNCRGEGTVFTETVTRMVEGQAGDSSFLRTFKEHIVEAAKLEGLYPDRVKRTSNQILMEKGSLAQIAMGSEGKIDYRNVPNEIVVQALIAVDKLKESMDGGNGEADGTIIDVESQEGKGNGR